MDKIYFNIISTCPVCGGSTEIRINPDSGVKVLYCTNPDCSGKLLNRVEHFYSKKGLDVKGISKATIEKLIDWGWVNSVSDVFELKQHEVEWRQKPGFGVLSVNKILNSIEEAKNTELWKVLAAASIPEVGLAVAKDLAATFKTYTAFRAAVDNPNYDFTALPNFGDVMADYIKNFDYSELDIIVENYLNIKEATDLKNEATLKGLQFCVTGKVHYFKNRDELKTTIEGLGGKVTGSVSSKTNYLINNDINSTTGKNKTAKELGVPIISEDDLVTMIG